MALWGQKGLKKTLSAWPHGRGCGRLKKSTLIRLEGVKSHPSSYLHFFTGRLRVLHRHSPANPYCVHCSPNQKKIAAFFCLQTIPGAPLRAPRSAKMDHKNANFGPAEPEISIIITKSLFYSTCRGGGVISDRPLKKQFFALSKFSRSHPPGHFASGTSHQARMAVSPSWGCM